MKKHLTALITILVSATLWAEFGRTAEPPPVKRVLILYSHRQELPINLDWDRGIRTAIEQNFPDPVAIDVEYIDGQRLDDASLQELWVALLRKKYELTKPDLVIPVHDLTATLFLNHYQKIFPEVPVVFCSLHETRLSQVKLTETMTGVVYRLEYSKTIDIALRLRPNTQRIVVVSGTARIDNLIREEFRSQIPESNLPIIDYWTGLPVDQLCEEVQRLPQNTVVLYISQDQDRDGRLSISALAVARRISTVSSVPVFGLYDTLIDRGIIGGCLARVEEQGRIAGTMAARILRGEKPASIPFQGLDTSRYVFDQRQLSRWHIRESDLPTGSIVLFQSEGFWAKYGVYLVSGITAIGLQSLLIAALLINLRRRHRAEKELQIRLDFEIRLGQELAQSQQSAKNLAGRLITVQEQERRRISREIHDDISQRLAACVLEIGNIEQQFSQSSSASLLPLLRNRLAAIADDVQSLSRRLHPAILEDLGLIDGIRSECARISQQAKTKIEFNCPVVIDPLCKSATLCLYRVAQEAIWNAIKHSGTKHVEVTLMADAEFVYLKVEDFGRGFDRAGSKHGIGLGIDSMRERLRLMNGSLSIQSISGKGSCVLATIPVSNM